MPTGYAWGYYCIAPKVASIKYIKYTSEYSITGTLPLLRVSVEELMLVLLGCSV